MFHSLAVKRYLLLLLVAYLLPIAVSAQSNPTPAACGLPTSGTITSSITYTLTADCTQTGQIVLAAASTVDPPVSLTISGNGYTIFGGTGSYRVIWAPNARNIVNLNDVTLDGEHQTRSGVVSIGGTLNAQRATLKRADSQAALQISGSGSATLNDVLFENNFRSIINLTGNGAAINMNTGTSAQLTDVVFRNNRMVNLRVKGMALITTSGCLSFSGNLSFNAFVDSAATWTDNSTGRCSGTIGNGDAAVVQPTMLACGFPQSGFLDASRTYTLNADCNDVGRVVVSDGVSIIVNGNGHTIFGSTTVSTDLDVAGNGKITFSNTVIDNMILRIYGSLEMNDATFKNAVGLPIGDYGGSLFRRTIFENNASTQFASVYLSLPNLGAGVATFSDVIFRNNSGGDGVIRAHGSTASITLIGCATFENNAAADTFASGDGSVTDNSSGPCGSDTIIGPTGPEPETSPDDKEDSDGEMRSEVGTAGDRQPAKQKWCQPMGVIGLICRLPYEPETIIEIWGITPNSEGFFIMHVFQSQVEALLSQRLVASSPDGRVAVRLIGNRCIKRNDRNQPRVTSAECIARELAYPGGGDVSQERYVVVSMGPNLKGKVYSVVFDHSLAGHVIGTVDTFTGLPGVRYAPETSDTASESSASAPVAVTAHRVTPQAARPDGSIIHVVQPGDTVSAIAIAYRVGVNAIIQRNQLPERGSLIHPSQKLVIRDAS